MPSHRTGTSRELGKRESQLLARSGGTAGPAAGRALRGRHRAAVKGDSRLSREEAGSAGGGMDTMIDERVGRYMAEHRVPGLALAVVRMGDPELLRGYGYASLELSVAAAPDTVFEI